MSRPAELPSNVALRVEGVGVEVQPPEERIRSLKEFAIRLAKGQIDVKKRRILFDVSFEARVGETIGVIGPNGSGKSTLLRVISRVLRPDAGRILIRGEVAPVIELGAGFDRDLSGRENIHLYRAILGYRPVDPERWFDEVVSFSGLASYIDSPLRTYSTGMVARLAFSVATAVEPDILALDEVLSVGDGWFQEKCEKRIVEFKSRGSTVLIVSHDLSAIRRECSRVIWLDRGRLAADGSPDQILPDYERAIHDSPASSIAPLG